jgi:Holliday junction resolvase RusA-like endonuclease
VAPTTLPSSQPTAEPLIRLIIPGQPATKGRPRAVWPKGHKRPVMLTPKATRVAEARLQQRLWAAYPRLQPLRGTLRLVVTFYCGDHRRRDSDNLVKLVKDAFNGRAYLDDSQVVKEVIEVIRGDPNPRTELELWQY